MLWLAVVAVVSAMPVRQARPLYVPTGAPLLAGGESSVCPHCNCEVRKLERHLRMCPKLAQLSDMYELPFYRHNANLGSDEVFAAVDPEARRAPPDADLVARIARAHASAVTLVRWVRWREPEADGGTEAQAPPSQREAEKDRHRVQCESIVRELAALGVVGTGTCHVEVGAGSAGLSYALASADVGRADAHVLLDLFLPRKKSDKLLRALGADFVRHKMLLQHLDLARMQEHLATAQPGKRVAVVSKHLCGAATDFALRAVARCERPVDAFALASCCHHRCEYGAYPNRRFFEQTLGLSHLDFERVCRMSSWAVNAPEQDAELLDAIAGGGETEPPLRRAELGRKCKDLLDVGRVLFLRGMGYDAWLAEYVSGSVTPENVLLLARPAQAGPGPQGPGPAASAAA